ncbi:MAG: cyclic nucleotide-binding domain-containing protein [Polyangiales bacterium]
MITEAEVRALPTLRDFSDDELRVLLGATQSRALRVGEVIWRQGELGRSCAIVVRGALEVLREGPEGTQRIGQMEAGSIVGQLALVDRGPRGATVRVTKEGAALELQREEFERLLRAASPLALRFQRSVALAGIRQYRSVIRRLASLPRADAEDGGRAQRASLVALSAVTTEWGLSDEELDAVEFVPVASVRPPPSRRP